MIRDFVGLSLSEMYAVLFLVAFAGGMATMYIMVWFYYGESTGTGLEAESVQ